MDELLCAPLLLQQPQQETSEVSLTEMATMISSCPEQLDEHQRPEAAGGESSFQSQVSIQSDTGSVSSGIKPKPKAVKLCVYTLKDGEHRCMKFESGRLTTVQEIMTTMLAELGLPKESDSIFSLWLTSRHLQLQLKPYHLPCKLFKRWKDLLSQYTTATFEEVCQDEPILSFQRNVFYPLRDERKLLKLQDPKQPGNYCMAIELLYHEAVFNTLRGRYPLPEEDIHTLAGLQAAIQHAELGKITPDRAEICSNMSSYYPSHMNLSKGSLKKLSKFFKAKSLQDEFVKSFQDAMRKCQDPHQLKILYLQLCWHKPYYGSVFFRGVVEQSSVLINARQVVLAVNNECLHLMGAAIPSEILLYLTYDQLSWEFMPAEEEGELFFSSLLLEFDSVLPPDNKKVTKRLQIFSRQAPMMDAMISCCVDCINIQEEELRKLRLQQGNKEFVDYSFKTYSGDSPRIQRQELNYKEKKLKCTVINPENSGGGSGFAFTFTRGFRKKRASNASLGASEGDQSSTTPLEEGAGTEQVVTPTLVEVGL